MVDEAQALAEFPGLDEVSRMLYKSWDELHSMERSEVEAFQLRAVKRRFEELRPKIAALATQADAADVTEIRSLDDVVPLLFPHTTYKSYPVSLIEKNRFDLMTRWLQGMTTADLSSVDASACEGIDDWLTLLDEHSPMMIFHTSGTSGKLSFFPRTKLEATLYFHGHLKKFTGFGPNERRLDPGYDGLRLPVIAPIPRYGRYTAQRMIGFLAKHVAPTPDQCYTSTNGTLSADLVALAGRVRMAQAKGQLSEMKLTDSMRIAFKRYLEELENRPQETAAFLEVIVQKLKGERIWMIAPAAQLLQCQRRSDSRPVGRSKSRPLMTRHDDMQRAPIGALCISSASLLVRVS